MDLRALAMGLAFALMWSSAFTSARVIVVEMPPILALAVRFFISGGVAVIWAAALGQSARLTVPQWRGTVIFGICQNALYLGLFFLAMQRIEAGLAAIIASTMPLLVALANRAFLGERLPWLGVAGLVAGFAGVAIILGDRIGAGADMLGLGYAAVGVLALAFATLAVRGASSGGNVLMIVGLQMLIGGAVLLVVGLALESWAVSWTPVLAFAYVYTIFVPGLAATFVWFKLVGRIGATRAATFHFLNPFFGVAIAAVFLGETLGAREYLGVAIITGGILAVQLARQRPAPGRAPTHS